MGLTNQSAFAKGWSSSSVSAGWRLRAATLRGVRRFFFDRGKTSIDVRGKTAEDHQLLDLLDPVAEVAGYEIVRLRLMGGDRARRLQVMAEDVNGSMLVEDCAKLARALSAVMDAADPIAGEYTLEVSSPGIDRHLTRLKDFAAWEGYEARLEIDRIAEGRKRFKGELAGVEGDLVAINIEGEVETAMIPFGWLVEAKLIVNDALMAAGAKARADRLSTQDGEGDEPLTHPNSSFDIKDARS